LLSTVFGDGSAQVNISPTAFLVDNCHNIFVAGWGGLVNTGFNPSTGTVDGMPITGDAFQSSTDGSDFYMIIFANDLADFAYGTFFGGGISDEHVDGGTSRFDKQGVVYHAVCAGCGGNDDFPTSEGVVSNTNNAPNCNLGVFKFSLGPPPTSAAFTLTPPNGCYPVEVDFSNLSINADTYIWDFGDGSTSVIENPVHTFYEPGVYTIRLIASIDNECGNYDTTYQTVEVFDYPVADFTMPGDLSIYVPVTFTDASVIAVTWNWSFGDGFTSTLQNPTHVYAEPGVYTVCLTVTNADGCPDTICKEVEIPAVSLLVVPNAFSPNGDGVNDEFLPLNYGLTEFQFRIYNRWGELIYETNDPTKGWNGIYNGVEQEMDVYVYVVSGFGEDHVFYSKQGNFTLVR
jgi:gliding motility-associated-like protein